MLLLSGSPAFANQESVLGLIPDLPVVRGLKPEGAHLYRLEVPPGYFIQVVVEQWGADVKLNLEGPEGAWSRDGYYEPGSVDRLSRVLETGGTYRLEVATHDSGPGFYVLRVEMRPPNVADYAVARAEHLSFQALVAFVGGELPEAIGLWNQSLFHWYRARDSWGEAEALYWSAKALERSAGRKVAAERFARAAVKYEHSHSSVPNAARQRARSLTNGGTLRKELGHLEPAEEMLREAIAAWEDLGVSTDRAIALGHLALVIRDKGDLESAREMLSECVEIWEGSDNQLARAQALTNLGHVEKDLGRYPEALDRLRVALGLWERVAPHHPGRISTLNSLGSVYTAIGEYASAIDYYLEARSMSRKLEEQRLEAILLNNLGRTYRHLEDFEQAEDHLQRALSLLEKHHYYDLQGDVVDNLGKLYLRRGDASRAVEFFRRALQSTRKMQNRREEAVTLVQLGETLWKLREIRQAAETLQEALDLGRKNQDPQVEARSLSLLALVAAYRKDYQTAARLGEEALSVVDSVRTHVLHPRLRSAFSAAQHDLYERHLDVLMDAHREQPRKDWFARAFVTRERAKSRALFELLREAKIDLRAEAPQDLVERERVLRERIAHLESRRFAALTRPEGESTVEQLENLIVPLLRDLDDIEAALRRHSSDYASLTRPNPVSLHEIQRDLLGPDDLILVYSLGKDRSFLWSITQRKVDTFELPGREAIHTLVRQLRNSIKTGNHHQSESLARELSTMLLAPASHRLRGKRLWILPDGLLHALPFAMLPHPLDSSEPLLADHAILYAPSLSILAELQKRPVRSLEEPFCVGVVADPVLGPTDPRWQGGSFTVDPSTTRGELGRLVYSAHEADAILELVSPQRRLLLEGFDASVGNVLKGPIRECGLVHFATHGLVDGDHPELSGLALSVRDASGQPLKGLLSLQDLYGLKLNANLVTLSACETALGREVRGEGLVGMTYGFFAAGARILVASLWDVDDRATAVLMEHFYQALLEEQLTPIEALRMAQEKIRAHPRWGEARHWAAFVLQGPGS